MLIVFPLFIMIVLSFISVVFGNSLIGITIDSSINNNLIVNGTTTNINYGYNNYTLNLDPLTTGIALITILIAVAGIIGINVLGSGLSDSSVHTITLLLGYGGLWTLFSTLSWNLIIAIELFGGFIWLGLTIIYSIGIVQKIGGS